jgi:hypothetical protein
MIKNNLPHLKTTTEQHFRGLPVNVTGETPIFISIIEKIYRELSLIMARYTKVVVVRLDLGASKGINPLQIDMSVFCRSFTRLLSAKYTSKVAYSWVREQGRKDYDSGMHFHLYVAVKIDENTREKTQATGMQKIILSSWAKQAGANSRCHRAAWFYLERNNFTFQQRVKEQLLITEGGQGVLIRLKPLVKRHNNKNIALGGVIDECFYAISYIAKVYSKVRTPGTKGMRVTGSSSLNTKDKRSGRQVAIEKNLKWIDQQLNEKIDPIPILEN